MGILVLHIILQFPKPESRIANVQTGITKPKLIILPTKNKMEIAWANVDRVDRSLESMTAIVYVSET